MFGFIVILGFGLSQRRGTTASGVAYLAREIAEHVEDSDESSSTVATTSARFEHNLLHGIDYQMLTIQAHSAADGQTLAALDLRCQTGATVLGIVHDDTNVLLPTGQSILCAGDSIAVTGSDAALARVRAVVSPQSDVDEHAQDA